MSDYTDDGFPPRERYEGPMASAAKAETKECVDCSGRGFRGVAGGLCATCSGTGIRTTGEVAGPMPSTREPSCPLCEDTGTVHFKGGDENCAACHARIVLDTDSPLPSTPDPVNPAELPSPTITVTTSGAATPPFPDRYLGTPASDGTTGEAAEAGTADRGSLGAGIAELSATIAEQSAEIERLKAMESQFLALTAEREGWLPLIERLKGDVEELKLQRNTAIEARNFAISDRDTLRLEVQKLKDLSFEAQDRYAALEAERDALNADVEKLRWIVNHHEPPHEAFARVVTEWNEVRADVERLNKEADSLAQQREHWQLRFGEACDELAEANARAEKYKRVIEATSANAATMVNVLIAMADAGLRMPPYLPYPAKQGETDHG